MLASLDRAAVPSDDAAMRAASLLLIALVTTVGCAPPARSERVYGAWRSAPPRPTSCASEVQCAQALEWESASLRHCPDRRYDCGHVQENLLIVAERLRYFRSQREWYEDWQREQEEQRRRAEAQAARDAALAERQQQEETAYKELFAAPCETTGSDDDCAPLRKFISDFPDGAHRMEVGGSIDVGRRARLARDRQDREKQAEAKRKSEEAVERAAAAKQKGSGGGSVRCCDGTISPTCTTVHRGCCSHHGGVCGG